MKPSQSSVFTGSLAALGLFVVMAPAQAWIYPEHRDIAVLAVGTLDPERKALFDRLWREGRTGHEPRLCEQGADTVQGVAPACIDWAALPAIAGDHACSSKGMLDTVMHADWILQVADVAAQLKVDLGRIAVDPRPEQNNQNQGIVADLRRQVEDESLAAERINALRTADIRLQRADKEYATRAGANNAHFLIPRPRTDTTPLEYAELALSEGSEINALGVYAWFHFSALQKAVRLAAEPFDPAERQRLVLGMLADEAFALHFLEDSYAAGHVAGTWGDVSQRKGTHDYYNEAGLEVFAWKGNGESTVLMGDAHMRPEDARHAANAVRLSLEQLIDHASGRRRGLKMAYAPAAPVDPDTLDVCKTHAFQLRPEGQRIGAEDMALLPELLGATPVPGLGPGRGSMPRFRAEVGPYIGIAGLMDVRSISNGFVPGEDERGWLAGAELAARFGLGLDGVMGESGDGLVFGSLGIRGDTRSTNKSTFRSPVLDAANGSAAVAPRFGFATRVRMPFYLIPGDLLLLAPVYLVSPDAYANMAVAAANGGLIPWQAAWATGIGRFQFVLGREVGATFYGYGFNNFAVGPSLIPGGEPSVVDFRSIHWDLPILEYRPYRAFDTKQSSALLFQLFAGVDVPSGAKITYPVGAPGVSLERIYSLGIRVIFDWRRYY